MTTNASRIGQRIEAHLERLGWSDARVVLEVAKHPDLGAQHSISASTVYRARHGSLLSTDTRHALATVIGVEKDDLWPPTVIHRARRRRATQPKELAA